MSKTLEKMSGDRRYGTYVALFLAAREAARDTDAVCSGEGPDELFCGYPCYSRYFDDPKEDFWLDVNTIMDVGEIPLLPGYGGDGFLKMNAFDLTRWMKGNILPNISAAAKGAGIEIRTPYMRRDLWDFALSLPVKYKADRHMGKLLFREAAQRYVGAEIAFREKRGFPVPVRKWMRKEPFRTQIMDKETMTMKKTMCALLAAALLLSLCACGGAKQTDAGETPAPASEAPAQTQPPVADWTREGYFQDENENFLSVTWMDDVDEPGWYVGVMLGEDFIEDAWGGTLQQDGSTLRGILPSSGSKDDLTVTVSEEGAEGVLLAVEGGGTYHFTPYDMPEATIFVTINTEGWGGMIGYEAGETVPELDPEWPYQSAQINLAEPETYTFAAAAEAGYGFTKWMKNGEDFSTEPVITVLLDGSADFVAVFEEDPDWQNPVMNFVGEYRCDRAHALVECFDKQDAWITIEWGGSAAEQARWDIVGRLDTETLTVAYSDCTKQIITYDADGEIVSQEPAYEDGSGTITFHNDGTFLWHEDQSEYGADMLFEWVPADPTVVRQDGERFETVVIIEGMEETVQYAHIVNDTLGFEMDYDYERFTRIIEADREFFVSVWDDDTDPENYLEVTYRAEDADTAAASVRAELSQEYDLLETSRELDRAGVCQYIEAAVVKGTNNMADQLQAVYIIPASDGCFVATAHFAAEAAEGFARRFSYMLQTFSVI